METQSKHTRENLEDLRFVQEENSGLHSGQQDRRSLHDEEAGHLRGALAEAISKCQLEIGQYLLETVFKGGVEAVFAKRPRPTDFGTSSRSGVRPQRNKLMARSPFLGRRR
ncbi:MAG: hypothetical protein WBG50_00475 [Desulfomonilaceae bacterium]